MVEDPGHLLLVERADELDQRLVVQLGEDGAGVLGGEEPEDADLVAERQLPHGRGDVGRVGGGEDVDETVVASADEQLLDGFGEPFRLAHYGSPNVSCGTGRASVASGQTKMPRMS